MKITKKYLTIAPLFSLLLIAILLGYYTHSNNSTESKNADLPVFNYSNNWIKQATNDSTQIRLVNINNPLVFIEIRTTDPYQLGIVSGHLAYCSSKYKSFQLLNPMNDIQKDATNLSIHFSYSNNKLAFEAKEILNTENNRIKVIALHAPAADFNTALVEFEKMTTSTNAKH